MKPKIPKKYQPRGFEILHEDRDIIVGNKASGILTVAALWEKIHTVHQALNVYVRKGQLRSSKCVYVVHRLDQATTGILIFAKTSGVQVYLKDNWKDTIKTYYAIVHGHLAKKSDTISSYLTEDEDYVIHSSQNPSKGKLSHTEYTVIKENAKYSLLKINLLTGRKNQIRVHLADSGHPVVGDDRYGPQKTDKGAAPSASHAKTGASRRQNKGSSKNLALHAWSIEFTHPFSKERMSFKAPVPGHFRTLVDYPYEKEAAVSKPPADGIILEK